jgi:hypothetical protein
MLRRYRVAVVARSIARAKFGWDTTVGMRVNTTTEKSRWMDMSSREEGE